jgi:hypothetical protein
MHRRIKSASKWIAILTLGIGTIGLSSHPALASEKGLAGIRCGRTALTVLKVYGNPTHVRVSGSSSSTNLTDTSSESGGMPGGLPGGMPGAMAGAMPGGLPGGMPGAMPGGLPGGMPGAMPGAVTDTSGATPSSQPGQEVIWSYDMPKGNSLEIYVDEDGVVDQVTVTGFKWSSIKTSRGITLGDPYKRVLAKYGFPDKHESMGTLQMIRYTEHNNVAFIFDSTTLKVVGIIVSRPS